MGKVFNMVVDESGVGVITFDVVGEAMNTWTEDAFIGFDRVMQELEIAKGIRGIIFISGKPENFLAGANLKLISQIESAEEVRTDPGPLPRLLRPPYRPGVSRGGGDPRPLPRRRSGILARLYGPDREGGEEHPHRPAGVQRGPLSRRRGDAASAPADRLRRLRTDPEGDDASGGEGV